LIEKTRDLSTGGGEMSRRIRWIPAAAIAGVVALIVLAGLWAGLKSLGWWRSPIPAVAETVMHWNYDTLRFDVTECIRRAEVIFRVKEFLVTRTGNAVGGLGPKVAVLVDCATISDGVHILVVAASHDFDLALRAGDEVRTAMIR
jgi:hypothetical protein